jgi:hypothetical protein
MKTIFAVIIAGTLLSLGIAQQSKPEQPDPGNRPAHRFRGRASALQRLLRGVPRRRPQGGVYPSARIERIISGEETLPGGHGTRAMPVWGPIFSQVAWDQDLGRLRIHNLATYIAHLQAH